MNELKELDKAIKDFKIAILKELPHIIEYTLLIILGMLMMVSAIAIDGGCL